MYKYVSSAIAWWPVNIAKKKCFKKNTYCPLHRYHIKWLTWEQSVVGRAGLRRDVGTGRGFNCPLPRILTIIGIETKPSPSKDLGYSPLLIFWTFRRPWYDVHWWVILVKNPPAAFQISCFLNFRSVCNELQVN